MKTSVSEIIRTEKYLRGELSPEDRIIFQARLLLDDELKEQTFYHKMVHRLVALYHRKKLKAEIEAVHDRLFNDPEKAGFRESIITLFKS